MSLAHLREEMDSIIDDVARLAGVSPRRRPAAEPSYTGRFKEAAKPDPIARLAADPAYQRNLAEYRRTIALGLPGLSIDRPNVEYDALFGFTRRLQESAAVSAGSREFDHLFHGGCTF